MTELHETCLHKLFSMWVTAEMQLEGIQMCVGSSLGTPGTPCASQPAACSYSRWRGMLSEGRHRGLMPDAGILNAPGYFTSVSVLKYN